MLQVLQRSQAELLRNQPTTFVPYFSSFHILLSMNLKLSVSASSPLWHGHRRASAKCHGWNRLEVGAIENHTHNGRPLELAWILMTNLSSHVSAKLNIQNLISNQKSSWCFDIDTWVWFAAVPVPPASSLSLLIKSLPFHSCTFSKIKMIGERYRFFKLKNNFKK